jgi:hypothetical protein
VRGTGLLRRSGLLVGYPDEIQTAADLSAVVLEGAAFPTILLPRRGWNAHLLTQKEERGVALPLNRGLCECRGIYTAWLGRVWGCQPARRGAARLTTAHKKELPGCSSKGRQLQSLNGTFAKSYAERIGEKSARHQATFAKVSLS